MVLRLCCSNEKVMGLQTNGMRPEEQLDKGTKSAKPMEIDVSALRSSMHAMFTEGKRTRV